MKFAVNEMAGRSRVERYELRDSGMSLYFRHSYRDLWVFDEIFRRDLYEPPAEVDRALRELGRPLQVVDLGGHVGMASLYFLSRWPDARITAFEPDPENAGLLRRTISANGREGTWSVIEACAANRDGTTEFVSGTGAMGHIGTASGDGGARPGEDRDESGFARLGGATVQVPLRDVFPFLGSVDLLKIDIEGGEWSILQDERFPAVPARAIVLEYHSFFGPPDPAGEVARILRDAGYTVDEPREPRPELGEGTLWAWRSE